MHIPSGQIESKKVIGWNDQVPVVMLKTLGGLYVVLTRTGHGVQCVGAGPHRGMALFVASKRLPNAKLDQDAVANWNT